MTEWERAIVERLREEVEMERKLVEALTDAVAEDGDREGASIPDSSASTATGGSGSRIGKNRLVSFIRSIYRSADPDQPPEEAVTSGNDETEPQAEIPGPEQDAHPQARKWTEYDLRKCGFEVVLDFSWTRTATA